MFCVFIYSRQQIISRKLHTVIKYRKGEDLIQKALSLAFIAIEPNIEAGFG